MLLLAAACAAAVVLREAARRPLGPPPSRLLTAASDGGARRQAQGSPPAPVPVSAPVAEPAPAPAAGGCFTAIPDHQILHEPPAPRAGVACRPFVAVVAPCTSRGKKYRDVAGTPYVDKFFQTVLKTLVQSEDVGYDVAFYIGYDAGDGIWDTDKARRDLPALLQSQVDRFYKKSVMEEIKSLDINANKHIPGVSVKMVRRPPSRDAPTQPPRFALQLRCNPQQLARCFSPHSHITLRCNPRRSSARARAWWRPPTVSSGSSTRMGLSTGTGSTTTPSSSHRTGSATSTPR
jgi:hypothetical protein